MSSFLLAPVDPLRFITTTMIPTMTTNPMIQDEHSRLTFERNDAGGNRSSTRASASRG